jgi:hypothetical protein
MSEDEDLPPGGIELSTAELAERWSVSWEPREVARRLAGVEAPWYVAAGWALELFTGAPIRPHSDIEIAVPAARYPEIRDRFPGYEFDAVGSGLIWESPTSDVLDAVFQSWLRDPATGRYHLDVFREPHDGDTWICRRDPSIRMPYSEVILRTHDGVPYLAPELVLLFKAKNTRPKDQADFQAVLPGLAPRQRETLGRLLAWVHPGHAWLAAV